MQEEHDKKIEKEIKKLDKKYKKEFEELNNGILKINHIYRNMICKIIKEEKCTTDYKKGCFYDYKVGYHISCLADKTLTSIFDLKGIYYNGKLKELNANKEKEIREVRFEYKKVKDKCKNLKTAKQCIKYLNELGFDTTSIEVQNDVLKENDIDKSKLFVCGENK